MSGNMGVVANRLRRVLPVLLLPLLVCTGCEAGQRSFQNNRTQGAKAMITYPVGRFAIAIPAEMKLDHQGQTLRACEIEDALWPANTKSEDARRDAWEKSVVAIKAERQPKGVSSPLIEIREVPEVARWARSVFYYGNKSAADEGYWQFLLDAGSVGVWIRFDGLLTSKEELFTWAVAVAKAYQQRRFGDAKLPAGNWFCTRHGAVNLPFLEQESATARFIGHPLGLKIKIKTTETYEAETEGHNLLGRLAAVLSTGYNIGVDVKKIRTGKRTVAGLPGEEMVLRLNYAGDKELSFMWRYAGTQASGERPEILIHMESGDGHVDAKLKVWDAVLDSVKRL